MRRILLTSALVLTEVSRVSGEFDSCTTIGVTPGASADGSAMVTHTSDCATCDSRVAYIPAQDWPEGSRRPVYGNTMAYPREVSNRSVTYHPVDGQNLSVPIGTIPQVAHTYGYWEAIYGYQNEHGLSLGESTAASKFAVDENNTKVLLWVRPLTQIAMERCKTARCAVETMGRLAEEYGFRGEDPGQAGGGECLILLDGKEVWAFEITGDDTQTSAFWAAKRVTDGHVVIMANNFVIREVDCDDSETTLCSKDLPARAKKAGVWNGHGKFDWMKAMAPDIRHFSYTPGFAPIPMYTTARLWRVFSQVAPSSNVELTDNPYILPFSVKAERPISHRDLMNLKRDHYEGSELDLTIGPLAGPFGNPNRLEGGVGLKAKGGQFPRAISLPRTSYSTVSQSFPSKNGSSMDKMWFASDAPASSVFVPFYPSASDCSIAYRSGNMLEYNESSAWWVFDFVANWMELNYRLMSVDVKAKINELQDMIDAHLALVEIDVARNSSGSSGRLSETQSWLQDSVVNQWRSFGKHLVVKYNDGRLNMPVLGQAVGYPLWWLDTFAVDSNPGVRWAAASHNIPIAFEVYGPGPFEEIPADAVELSSTYAVDDAPGRSAVVSFLANNMAAVSAYTATFLVGLLVGRRSSAAGGGARLVGQGYYVDESYYVAAPAA